MSSGILRKGGDGMMKLNTFRLFRTARPLTADEKKRRLRGLRRHTLIFSLLLSFVLALGGSFAWYTVADNVVNNLVSRDSPSRFHVRAVDEFTAAPDHGVYAKRVGAVNLDNRPAFARLLVSAVFVIDSPAGGPPIVMHATIGPPGSGAMVIMADFNASDWKDGGDGYFYYLRVLHALESTDTGWNTGNDRNLFNTVTMGTLPAGYENARLVIEVACEAVGVTPPGEYINGWWHGVTPAANPLLAVHTALQNAK